MNKLKTHNELLGQYVRIKYPEIEEEFEEIYQPIKEIAELLLTITLAVCCPILPILIDIKEVMNDS